MFNTNTKTREFKFDSIHYVKALFELMKPRVMSLAIFTCVVGFLITPFKNIDYFYAILSITAVALGSGAAGSLNCWYEADVDKVMSRTCLRPIPTGKLTKNEALIFGVISSFVSVGALYLFSNLMAASLLALTILFYVFVYTIWLKRKTSQNIVIGGAAGALPPVIGWAIATGNISIEPLILFLIIFVWTPSHFWALSLLQKSEYTNVTGHFRCRNNKEKYICLFNLIISCCYCTILLRIFGHNLFIVFLSFKRILYFYLF